MGYDPGTHQDKFYGAGLGGYSAWDISHPETPKELFTITGLGYDVAHTFTPSPDGHYAVTETEYQYTPLRIWDLSAAQKARPTTSTCRSVVGPQIGVISRTITRCAGRTYSSRRMRTGCRSSTSRTR